MEFVEFLGDDRLRHKIVYSKNGYSQCIYCGEEAKTREHIPSKAFLTKPYPDNLGIVPACFKCNNSFSKDEIFLSILIEKLKHRYYGRKYIITDEFARRVEKNRKIESEIDKAIDENKLDGFYKRILNIIFKLSIGHAVFEVSEGYCIKKRTIDFSFLNQISKENLEEFLLPFIISDELLPEMGSRAYERIRVVDIELATVTDEEQKLNVRMLMLDWVDVQISKYSYTSYRFGNEIIVKLIINEFLYAKTILYLEESDV